MATRSYGQQCGLAAAMDLVGQRWSLLIVRDLAPGPRRFTDLFQGLTGIATDVLADRLRELESAGVVELQTVKHPAPAKLYSLTDRGEELAAITVQLADWGRPLLEPMPSDGVRVRARWALQTMSFGYLGGVGRGDYEFTIDDDELVVHVDASKAKLRYGRSTRGAVAGITCSTQQFFQAAKDPAWLLKKHRGLAIEGDAEALRALLEALPLRIGDATIANG